MKKRSAFTLIEMLVVVVVIFILAGIVMKLASVVAQKQKIVKATTDLHQLRNALNEYHVEYGTYPPVNFVLYEYENCSNQTKWFREVYLPQHRVDSPDLYFADSVDRNKGIGYLGYRYGLVSYLWPRAMGNQIHSYDSDKSRDVTAKAKWAEFLVDVGLSGGVVGHPTPAGLMTQAPYSNDVASIYDPWGREYKYVSPYPHVHFKLWSYGPDGVNGTKDDLTAEDGK